MTWTDLILIGLSATYLSDYCEQRWRTQLYSMEKDTQRWTSAPGWLSLSFGLWTRFIVCVQRQLSRLHWAALSVALVFQLVGYLPAGLAYGLMLPIYVSAIASGANLVRSLHATLRPNVPPDALMDKMYPSPEEQAVVNRRQAWEHVLMCKDCRARCEDYWRRRDAAGPAWSFDIEKQLNDLSDLIARHPHDTH